LPSRLSSRWAIGLGFTFGGNPTGLSTEIFCVVESAMASLLEGFLKIDPCSNYSIRQTGVKWAGSRRSAFHFVQHKMAAVAFLRLITGGEFAHGVVRRRAAMAGVGFDAVPFDHQNHPARIFDGREQFDRVGAR